MKSTSPAAIMLSMLAAAAIGVATTWTLMRRVPPVIVIAEQAPERDGPDARSRSSGQQPNDEMDERVRSFGSSPSWQSGVAKGTDHALTEITPVQGQFASENLAVNNLAVNAGRDVSNVQPQFTAPGTAASLSRGTIDDALSFALEAADPYVKEGFTVREDYWGGDLPAKQKKAIVHHLFKGNEYWFWMGTDSEQATIGVHVFDFEGNLAEVQAWQKGKLAAARVVPKATGSYYLIVEIEKSDQERTHWALAYGYR